MRGDGLRNTAMDITGLKSLIGILPQIVGQTHTIKPSRRESQFFVTEQLSEEEIVQIMQKKIMDFQTNNSIRFSYDASIKRVIVQILNGETKELVKQIPPEEMVRFLKAFNELVGLMVDRKV